MEIQRKGAKATEKIGFTFWQSYYDAYKAAQTIGKGDDYLHAILAFAFEGVEPKTDDPFLSAFYSAAIPTIKTSIKNVRNGQKNSGAKPTISKGGSEPTIQKQQNRTEQNRNKQNRKNISYLDATPSYDTELFKEKAHGTIEYKPKEGA